MNKLFVGAASAALLLASVVPAFAFGGPDNVAIIKGNDVTVGAYSGYNSQSISKARGGNQTMTTGASKACGVQVIGANITLGHGGDENLAVVKGNDLGVETDTGVNSQSITMAGGGNQTLTTRGSKAAGGQLIVTNLKISH